MSPRLYKHTRINAAYLERNTCAGIKQNYLYGTVQHERITWTTPTEVTNDARTEPRQRTTQRTNTTITKRRTRQRTKTRQRTEQRTTDAEATKTTTTNEATDEDKNNERRNERHNENEATKHGDEQNNKHAPIQVRQPYYYTTSYCFSYRYYSKVMFLQMSRNEREWIKCMGFHYWI